MISVFGVVWDNGNTAIPSYAYSVFQITTHKREWMSLVYISRDTGLMEIVATRPYDESLEVYARVGEI